MERRRVTYGLFAMLLISALIMAAPVSAQPTADSFGVNDACGTAGAVIGVPVIIENAQNGPINAVQFSITYNTSVITVSGVQQGALTSDWSFAFVNTVGGTTTVGLFVLAPSSAIQNGATGTVAIINFNVVGANGSSSGMNMSNIQLQNTSYQIGTAPAKNGVFWVGAEGFEEVPALLPTGLIALISALSAIAAVAIVRKRR